MEKDVANAAHVNKHKPKRKEASTVIDENGLTEKQRRFCDYYLIDPNGTQAAIKAGYAEKNAHVEASRLLRNAKIRSYLMERNSQFEKERVADMQEVKEFWTEQIRKKESLKASELIAKTYGAFVDRVDMSVSGKIEINIIDDDDVK